MRERIVSLCMVIGFALAGCGTEVDDSNQSQPPAPEVTPATTCNCGYGLYCSGSYLVYCSPEGRQLVAYCYRGCQPAGCGRNDYCK